MISQITRNPRYAAVFLRAALGFSFLSAVADRFGLWGAYGQPHVAWGDFPHFVVYTGKLNWFVPASAIPAIALMATAAETALGVALLLGLFPRLIAALSGILLLMFAVTMALALGIKAPLDASVFSASAGAFLLAFVLSMRSPSPTEAGDSNSPVRRSGS
jgi:uncharacterized membrane protein YphA (DoxX/SURF4 family)